MQRIEGALGQNADAPVDLRQVEFDEEPATAVQKSAAEERLAYLVSQGIQTHEGIEALNRALALGQPQVIVSSLDLPDLIRDAQRIALQDAAPKQQFERPDSDVEYAEPTNEIERHLAGFWQDLLGVKKVGIHDSFFDLGGHSLIAVRLFALIKKTFQTEFPISVLFEAPTIEKCAALISERVGEVETGAPRAVSQDQHKYLVPMHAGPETDKAPLFVVAGMFGNVLNLRGLAQLVGGDRAFYGLQAKGLMGDVTPHETIEQAAADYIAELKQIQPEGPYYLGGFSGGGITAFEMAQQLYAAGDEVAALIMLDTPLPVRPALTSRDKALIKLQEVQRKGPGYLAEWFGDRVRWELEKRKSAVPDGGAAPEQPQFHNEAIEQAFRNAVAHYSPKLWDGPLTLFRPPLDRHWQVSGGAWVSREREYVFDDNQWRNWAPGMTVNEVPGDHDSMVLEPNVRTLVRRMQAYLDAAERQLEFKSAPLVDWASATAAE